MTRVPRAEHGVRRQTAAPAFDLSYAWATALSLIPELDDIVRNGTPERRAEAIERISALFLKGAAHFETQHVALFDDILVSLVPATEIDTRVDLAERLSKLDNAPPALVKQLAHESEIKIAGPILSNSPLLDDPTLVEIAQGKGQEHLAAISGRPDAFALRDRCDRPPR